MIYKKARYFLKFLLLFFMLLTFGYAADLKIENAVTSPTNGTIWAIDSSKDPKEAIVAVTITNLVESPEAMIDLILAIDCSASLGPDQNDPSIGSDPRRLRIDAAKRLVAQLRQSDRVGVVLWNETVIGSPLDLTNNSSEVNAYLDTAGSSGETSLWNALNASKLLLKQARPSSKRVIVLFSDGNDTIEPTLDFKGLASGIKQSGIDIYTVGLGKKDKIEDLRDVASPDSYYHVTDSNSIPEIFSVIADEIMRSINGAKVYYELPAEIEVSDLPEGVNLISSANGQKTMLWNIGSMLPRESKAISFKVRSETMGSYNLGNEDRSNVTFIKTGINDEEITQAIEPARIEVKGEAGFSYSGIGKGGTIYIPFSDEHPEYGLTVTKSIERTKDGGCQDIVINYKVPTMPCNRTVVFALDTSGSILQSGLNDVMVREISDALGTYLNDPEFKCARIDWDAMNKSAMVKRPNGDLVSMDPENSSIDYSSEFRSRGSITELFNGTPRMFAKEFESTFYNAGLEEANDKIWTAMLGLDAFERETNSFSIIFITDRSELVRNQSLENATDFAKRNHIQINCIGINMGDPSTIEEEGMLRMISTSTGGRLALINDPSDISEKIEEILDSACTDNSFKPVVNNLTIVESLYPYLKVDGTSIPPSNGPIRNNTLVWNLGNLSQGVSSSIRINTSLNFGKLPVDVTEKRTPVSFSPSPETKASMVSFTTNLSELKEPKTRELPEGELSIFCGQGCEECPKQIAAQTATLNDSSSAAKEMPLKDSTDTPGFEIYLAILGIVASLYLARRR